MVTSVGMQIIRGKHLYEGGFSDLDALNYLVALLCHDVGYVKGACRQDDQKKSLFDDGEGGLVEIPATGTCALLSPHHVSRSKQFVNEHFVKNKLLDLEAITQCIERTRFPVPEEEAYQATADLPGLTRAADLIGQLGDPEYLRKIPALFYEFQELGQNQEMGYNSPGELRKGFAQFFWSVVRNYRKMRYLFCKLRKKARNGSVDYIRRFLSVSTSHSLCINNTQIISFVKHANYLNWSC